MTEEEKRNIEILNNIKEYMQNSIDRGYHKFIYNDLGSDEKCVDIINAIDYFIEKVKQQQKEIEELKDRNKELTETIEEWVNGERINDIKHISKDKIRNLLKQVNASLYHFKDSEKNNIVQRVKDKLEQLLEE